jgi:P27 family predicted phage terminase small subunit
MKPDILDAAKPPRHLSAEAKRIWKQLNHEWVLNADNLLVLRTGLEAFDRMQEARRILDDEGLTVTTTTAHGGTKVNRHPAASIEKESRQGFLSAFKMLGFDAEDVPASPGRPSYGKSKWR